MLTKLDISEEVIAKLDHGEPAHYLLIDLARRTVPFCETGLRVLWRISTDQTVNAERKLALSRALVEQTAKYLEQVRELVKDVNQFWAFSLVCLVSFSSLTQRGDDATNALVADDYVMMHRHIVELVVHEDVTE